MKTTEHHTLLQPTPTASAQIKNRLADFTTLAEALNYAAQGEAGFNFYDVRGQLQVVLPYADVRTQARLQARQLLAYGLNRGDKVGIVADMEAYFLTTFFACQYAGLIAVPLPVITGLGGRHGYEKQLHTILQKSEARIAISTQTLLPYVQEASTGLSVQCITPEGLAEKPPLAEDALHPLGAEEQSHIQFSSGSTRQPKGVVISQKAMLNNAFATMNHGLKANQFGRVERVTSWLPFYHDMGLIGCMLTPICCQFSVDLLHTDAFARAPLQWLYLIVKNQSTLSYAPNFAYDICARRVARLKDEGLNLSSWRVAGIGGEMVHAQTLSTFAEAFAPYGFDPKAFTPSYGLAEATLAVSFSPVGRGYLTDAVEKEALKGDLATPSQAIAPNTPQADSATVRVFTSCGEVLPSYELQILAEDGAPLPQRHIGRVCLRTPSLMTEYFKEPEATLESALPNGWLDTGDMGYLLGKELFITGRRKDMIIINGKNIWPQDMEWHAENNVADLRSRDTAAFAVETPQGKEEAVLLVQTRTTEASKQTALQREIHAAVYKNTGVDARVVLVPPKSLPFTTSGKLSRAKAKQAYLSGVIQPLLQAVAV